MSGSRVIQTGHQALGRVVGRGGGLKIPGGLAFLGNHKVGECATNVDSNHVHGRLLPYY